MSPIRPSVLGAGMCLLSAIFAHSQVVYIPPGGPHPLFGGEIALSEPGPVADYWRTMCMTAHDHAQEHRDGPLATPPLKTTLQSFVSGLIANKPNYDDMTPAMAAAVRANISTYEPSLIRMGSASAAKQVNIRNNGTADYVVDEAGGETHWNIAIDAHGKIESAFICKGQGL